ncbi:hypothetical protein PENTCL1PPCAC_20706, partial [Pristionchus entomophagus]
GSNIKMGDIVAYQQWLVKHQCRHRFVNNYWCAALSYELEENKLDDSFQIPYFIVEEELTKEDNNVNLENAHISNALRHWLIHLLNARKMQANVLNYEGHLRDFIDKTLPSRVSNPLTVSTSFHNLPTECKLWIFYSLRVYDRSPSVPRKILKDPLGNYYYIEPDCRMYVHLARRQQTSLPIDEERLSKEPWGSLYRFVHSQSCFLLCENEDEWNAVWKIFLSFKLSHLFYALRAEMKLSALNTNIMKKDEQRKEFEEVLIKLAPVPKERRIPPKKHSAASTEEENVNVIQTNLEAIVVEEPMIPTKPTEAKPKKISNQIMGKCWNFPQCPLFERCKYVHPRNPCTKFPNCPRGWECLFLHEFCPDDATCEEPNCAYEHLNSITTYYRMTREPEETIPRPIALVPPTMRKSSSELDKIGTASTTPAIDKTGFTQQNRKRCQNFPQCKKEGTCAHFHPTLNCRKLAAGIKCPGQWCLFKHGPCPIDGECDDLKCIYEHHKSTPVVVRRYAAKQKHQPMARTASISDLSMDKMKFQNHGSLSRSTSFSNLSMVESESPLSRSNSISNISVRSRRKSVTFADDSDGECIITTPSRKESNNQKPVGILRLTTVTSKERCSFFPRCKNKRCEFAHPTEKCPVFPKCPNGGACMYLHGVCEKDGVCSRRNCDSEHNRPHEVDNTWCKNGSLCERVDCKFLHPKECVGRCPTPGDCWMYHRPKPSAAAAARPADPPLLTPPHHGPGYQGPGYPTGPGYGPVPLFGYGPNLVHAPPSFAPGYGPGPGYPVGSGMVPGGYGPNPGYGYGPG